MGIHTGPVYRVEDINLNLNVSGGGINLAQRVMDCGDAGHILLSGEAAGLLRQIGAWPLHDLGECEVKHGERLHLFNLFGDDFGNESVPTKIKVAAAATEPERKPARPHALAAFIAATVVIAFAVFGVAKLRPQNTRPNAPSPSQIANQKSIAVLPFANLSAESKDEWFSDGMADAIITALSTVEGLDVRSRTSSFKLRGKGQDVRKIGSLLSVNTVLEGSVQRAGDKLRIFVQLINVANDSHFWSQSYDGDMKSVFDLQDRICREIVGRLKVKLAGAPGTALVKRDTTSTKAYDLYLLGRHHAARISSDGYAKAIDCFNRAIAIDPDFAPAYAGLAYAGAYYPTYLSSPKQQALKAKRAAQKALALDDTLAEAHVSMAYVFLNHDWNSPKAEREFKRAVALNSNYALAHDGYGYFCQAMGRFDEAISAQRKALQLDPLSPLMNVNLAWAFYEARLYDQSIEQSRKTIDLDPNFPDAHRLLALCYFMRGKPREAIEEHQKARSLDDSPWIIAWLGHNYAASGNRVEALKVLAELNRLSKRRYVSPACQAVVHLGLDERDRFFQWMEKAYDDRDFALVWLGIDEPYDPVRSDPRFKVLLKKVGLSERSVSGEQ